MHVAVVGGGMAGLAAAWRLRRQGLHVTLIDDNPDLGGRCRTFLWHGRWLIRGAAAFVGAEKNLIEQAEALGIYRPDMVRDMTDAHSFDVPKGGKVHTLKQFAPADILMSSLVPAGQKIALGLVLPSLLRQMMRNDSDDPTSAAELDTISACAYFRKHSPDFVEYILEPVMSMFCGYGEDDYSLAWLMWLMASDKAWANSWWTFDERGVGQLSQSLEAALRADEGTTVLAQAKATSVTKDGSWRVVFEREGEAAAIDADAVVMAVPGSAVIGLVPGLPAGHRAFFRQVRYVPHHILYAITDAPERPEETHMMLPTAEAFSVLSNITVAPDPKSGACFVYGEIKGEACTQFGSADDKEILSAAMAEAIRIRPDLASVAIRDSYLQRNDIALCSRHVGYTRALKQFRTLPAMEGLAFAGDYLINSSVGSAHRSGVEAADLILSQLKAHA